MGQRGILDTCTYLVGAGWKPGSKYAVTKAQLLAAAKLLHHRVPGH